ncbi:transcriptional regulator BetI [Pleionea sp. CnH1-48]|uniref:transcriptional regulator BetI n=1 Tax=Pleionea sp. CnH1-48 TaxID=2954494 RepID=UPI002098560E|nr:transcriptional regulator BetI [Pleionea sp. CnH1-48]MCO7223268.1 transcriptional regulator BetI [Pleionea sp. CnH1-48]
MPKLGMTPIRRQELIEATIETIAELGYQKTTLTHISKRAGLSSGIISHYFGSKQELIEASVRYLIGELKRDLLKSLGEREVSAEERLMLIVEANFSSTQIASANTKNWLTFWSQSMHDPMLKRLQRVNSKRLANNLLFSFKELLPIEQAKKAALTTAAMIDGFWLRFALSHELSMNHQQAIGFCKGYIKQIIESQEVHEIL